MNQVFERLGRVGRDAVEGGHHDLETPPSSGGRWGPSIVLLPTGDLAAAFDGLTQQLSSLAGSGQWPSGASGRAHVTVRALAPYESGSVDPDRTARQLDALRRSAATAGAVEVRFDGLVVTASGVIARGAAVGSGADVLRTSLGEELGDDGWLERAAYPEGRDPIWYGTLLHFAAPVRAADELVRWVDARRALAIGSEAFGSAHLCRWEYDGEAMARNALGRVTLSEGRAG